MLRAMEAEDWPAVRAYMRTILDIDPRNRRSPRGASGRLFANAEMPPLEYAPSPVQYVNEDFWQQDENEDFWEVNQQDPMPALHALNIEDDWGYQPVINNEEIAINNNNNNAAEDDWGDWAGEGQGAAVIAPPPSTDFQQN